MSLESFGEEYDFAAIFFHVIVDHVAPIGPSFRMSFKTRGGTGLG
jgi:hypothetical protein